MLSPFGLSEPTVNIMGKSKKTKGNNKDGIAPVASRAPSKTNPKAVESVAPTNFDSKGFEMDHESESMEVKSEMLDGSKPAASAVSVPYLEAEAKFMQTGEFQEPQVRPQKAQHQGSMQQQDHLETKNEVEEVQSQLPHSVPILAEQDMTFSLASIAEGTFKATCGTVLQFAPTLAELKTIDGITAAVTIYARVVTTLAVAAVAAGVGAVLLSMLALVPALLLITFVVAVGVSTPMLLVMASSAITNMILPATVLGYKSKFATTAVMYPITPFFSLALCGGLLVTTVFYPLVYACAVAVAMTAALSARAAAFVGVTNRRRVGIAALLAVPAVGPNFFVTYVLVLPFSFFSAFIWVPAVAVQTWLLVFPALAALLFLRSDTAFALASPRLATVRKLAEDTSNKLNALTIHWAPWLLNYSDSTPPPCPSA